MQALDDEWGNFYVFIPCFPKKTPTQLSLKTSQGAAIWRQSLNVNNCPDQVEGAFTQDNTT